MPTHLVARLATLSLLVFAALLGGCGEKLPPGPVPSDYAESPLKDEVKAYENALRVSNAVLERLEKGDTQGVYHDFLDARLQQQAPVEKFGQPMQVTLQKFGPIRAFKPMQWGFAVVPEDGRNYLYSTKIVAHERGWMIYRFRFEDDGKYEKLVGMTVLERKPGAAPAPAPAPAPAR